MPWLRDASRNSAGVICSDAATPGGASVAVSGSTAATYLFCGFDDRPRGKRMVVPLYCCRACGFATTATWRNAVMAHHAGSPECEAELEMVVSFAGRPRESGRVRAWGEGSRPGAESRDPASDPARGSA
jgi:hypothetical protein